VIELSTSLKKGDNSFRSIHMPAAQFDEAVTGKLIAYARPVAGLSTNSPETVLARICPLGKRTAEGEAVCGNGRWLSQS
jgi:hypothetical protein